MNRSRSGNAVLRTDPVDWAEPVAVEPVVARPFLVDEEYLLEERRQARAAQMQQWVLLAVLVLYAAVIAIGIAFHEPWADEAQAWLLARDSGFWHLMFHAIRYEGSPGLWHAFLWVLARAHVDYIGMRWVSGVMALAGVYVLLRWSPFPLILKILLPFGFWFAYQDSVVARSYVLFAILAFPAAALLRSINRPDHAPRRSQLVWLAILLGLMANLSAHGFVASIGFALVGLALLRRKVRAGLPAPKRIPAAILCCFWLFVFVTIFPPSDVDFPAGRNLQMSVQKVWATLGSQKAKTELKDEKDRALFTRAGELPMHAVRVFQKTPGEARWRRIARILGLITFPISNFRFLALAACALVVLQAFAFRRARGAIGPVGLLPWVLMIAVFSSMYLAPRHAGMLWEALVASLWLTWPAKLASNHWQLWLRRATVAALVLVGINQVQWTARSVWDDIHKPYSGDEAMAQWLRTHEAGKSIAGFGYHSIGVAAWFHRPLYFNQPATYWIWSQEPRVDARAPFAIASHPDVILFGGWDWSEHNADISEDWIKPDPATLNSVPLNDDFGIIAYAEAHGYRETHRFCGHAFLRSGYSEELCQVALQPVPGATPSGVSSELSLNAAPEAPGPSKLK
ncbi:MAG: hypothetical protein ACLGXA_12550 [Acidobacteriota bacterium]